MCDVNVPGSGILSKHVPGPVELTRLEERRLSYCHVAMTKHEGDPRATRQHLPHINAQIHISTRTKTQKQSEGELGVGHRFICKCGASSASVALSSLPYLSNPARSEASADGGGREKEKEREGERGDRKFLADSLNGDLDVAPNVLFLSLQCEGALARLLALACCLFLALSQRDSGMHCCPHVLEYLQPYTHTSIHVAECAKIARYMPLSSNRSLSLSLACALYSDTPPRQPQDQENPSSSLQRLGRWRQCEGPAQVCLRPSPRG